MYLGMGLETLKLTFCELISWELTVSAEVTFRQRAPGVRLPLGGPLKTFKSLLLEGTRGDMY